ncbi:MAG: PLDc N-terminal domain-containing protein [Phycisphaerae bacterium]
MPYILGILVLALDIWMILDIVKKPFETLEKVIWILVILVFPVLGAAIYFFLKYKSNQ